MATISITIPDAVLQRVISGICYNHGYQDNIPGPTGSIPNPVPKSVYAKAQLKKWVKDNVVEYESRMAADAARQAAVDAADSDITIGD